jgi:hypothetical protein
MPHNIESHIRGMSVPTQDRIWWCFREEHTLLKQLLSFDFALVHACEQIYQYVTLTPETWNNEANRRLLQLIQQVTQVARDRERFLLLPA